MRIPKVGQNVQFFRSGKPDKDPVAAIITGCNDEGVANLVEVPKFGGMTVCKLGIRHAQDPWHAEHPDASRMSGCWEFIPEDNDVEESPKPLPEPKGRK